MQLPRLHTKEAMEAAVVLAPRVIKPVAPRAELGFELEEVKKLAVGGAWRWLEPRNEACRQGSL